MPIVQDTLENCVIQISKNKFWRDGWRAIRQTLHYDKDCFDDNSLRRIIKLEKKLAPTNIYDQAQVYAFTPPWDLSGVDDFYEDRITKINDYTEELGLRVIQEEHIFQKLLPDLVTQTGNIHVFGIGLVKGSNNPTETWNQLLSALSSIPEEKHNVTIFSVFLDGMYERDREWYETTLENAVYDEFLVPYFPLIQCQCKINETAVERLFRSLQLNKANIWQYRDLAHGKRSCEIENNSLAKLLYKISEKEGGKTTALHILYMRFHSENEFPINENLLKFGQDLSLNFTKDEIKHTDKHNIRAVIKRSFAGATADEKTRELCCAIREDLENNISSRYDYESYFYSLLEVQPQVVLDEILLKYKYGGTVLSWRYSIAPSPILRAPLELIIKWCEVAPQTRYPLVAMITPLFIKDVHGKITSTPYLTKALLDEANNYPKILIHLGKAIYPSSWSGKRSAVLTLRIPILESLQHHRHTQVQDWAVATLKTLIHNIEKEKSSEDKKDRERHESFE